MKTIELTKEQKQSIANYRRMGIEFEDFFPGYFDGIKVTQKRLVNGYILNQKQLYDRAKEVFPDRKILPVVYSLDVNDITVEWIENRMTEFGIKRNDLIKQLAIDKSTLSLFFSGGRGLTKSQKAAFFFFFLTYELNRDFREHLDEY